jgi:hypothetical protein
MAEVIFAWILCVFITITTQPKAIGSQ